MNQVFVILKHVFHVYSFFFLRVKVQFEFILFSFVIAKLVTSFMLAGGRAASESMVLSLFFNFKIFIGLPAILLIVNSILASRTALIRTHVFLSGRGHIVPTPSAFDKQFKGGFRMLKLFLRKRQYLRDVLKRSLTHGRFLGRRLPLYKRISKLSSLFLRTQGFFVFSELRNQRSRFLKHELFNLLNKNIYLFILQRTYIQYRWR